MYLTCSWLRGQCFSMIEWLITPSQFCAPPLSAVGVFLFSFLCVLGSSLFALGSHFRGTPYLLPLMLTGRLLFGSGNGSLTSKAAGPTLIIVQFKTCFLELPCRLSLAVVQNRITAFWFKGKELALAFGLTLAFSRLGSVLNFFLTQKFEESYGMQWTLWGGRFEPRIHKSKTFFLFFSVFLFVGFLRDYLKFISSAV